MKRQIHGYITESVKLYAIMKLTGVALVNINDVNKIFLASL